MSDFEDFPSTESKDFKPLNMHKTFDDLCIDRPKLINWLISKYNYKSYLEIGCSENLTFNQIKIEKQGVDPVRGGTHRMTSDHFFEINTSKFDIIFVDGLHWCEQAYKDIINSLAILNDGGVILMHDCLPYTERIAQWPFTTGDPSGAWCGDVWKAYLGILSLDGVDSRVGDWDWGIGVIKKKDLQKSTKIDWKKLTYSEYENIYKKHVIKPVKWAEMKEWLQSFD